MHNPVDPNILAFHESGHALAAWRLGACLEYVSIEHSAAWADRDGNSLGFVKYHWPNTDKIPGKLLEEKALISCAGPAAQKIYAPKSDIAAARKDDYENLNKIATLYCRNPRSVGPFRNLAKFEATYIVHMYWHCVSALASELVRRGYLDGTEATAIMESAEVDRRSLVLSPSPPQRSVVLS